MNQAQNKLSTIVPIYTLDHQLLVKKEKDLLISTLTLIPDICACVCVISLNGTSFVFQSENGFRE